MSNQKQNSPSLHRQLANQAKTKATKELNGFKNFLESQNVVGIAVGLAVGAAASSLASSFIKNIVLDPLAFLLGETSGFAQLSFPLKNYQGQTFNLQYGAFLDSLINFLVIALIFYLIVHSLGLDKKKK